MSQQPSKNWWQTAAGVMTGLAALLTAIAGLIVALAQTGFINRDRNEKQTDDSKDTIRPYADVSPASTASPINAKHGASISRIDAPSPAPATRSPRAPISLPEKREYVLGSETVKARYVLTDANITHLSQESTQVTIKVHFAAEGRRQTSSNLSSAQFTLAIEDIEIDAEPRFTEQVRFGDSIDRYVNFTVPSTSTVAVLRIKVGWDSHAEIPLTLAPIK